MVKIKQMLIRRLEEYWTGEERAETVGLKFNPKKVKLRVPELSYVGHLFSAEGFKPDPDKS